MDRCAFCNTLEVLVKAAAEQRRERPNIRHDFVAVLQELALIDGMVRGSTTYGEVRGKGKEGYPLRFCPVCGASIHRKTDAWEKEFEDDRGQAGDHR